MRSKMIGKYANKYSMLVVEDLTNPLWDASEYSKLNFKFIKLDGNSTDMIIPVYVDVEEFRAILKQIVLGRFSQIYRQKNGIYHKIYGGSSSYGGKTKTKNKGKLTPVIDGVEAKIFTIMLEKNNGKAQFKLQAEISKGTKGSNGQIKFTGQNKKYLYFAFAPHRMLEFSETILNYLQARQNVALNRYFKPASKEELSQLKSYLKTAHNRMDMDVMQYIWNELRIPMPKKKGKDDRVLTQIEVQEIINLLEDNNIKPQNNQNSNAV
ncbi:MAG: hypothetical protein ACQEQD_06695 [Bacillota bacterium]